MIERIDVYNVQFGDCIYLHMKDRGVLTDCGTKAKKTKHTDEMIHDILDAHKYRSLVVTHFHDDHYNLIDRFQGDSFDRVFVPDFFSCDSFRILLFVLLFETPNSSIYRFAKEMIELIPNISNAATNAELWFVKKDDNIHGMEVLWPDPDENRIRRLADSLEYQFGKYIRRNYDKSRRGVLNLLPRFVLAHDMAVFYDDSREKRIDLTSAAKELTAFFDRVSLIRKELEIPQEGLIDRAMKKEISQIQNSCSIVFHNTVGENTGLFLGDVDREDFERFILPCCSKEYKCIKTAHHGTRDYFTKMLPQSDYLIISNGGVKNWPISGMYKNCYRDREFICTNGTECEFMNSLPRNVRCSCCACGFPEWSKYTIK